MPSYKRCVNTMPKGSRGLLQSRRGLMLKITVHIWAALHAAVLSRAPCAQSELSLLPGERVSTYKDAETIHGRKVDCVFIRDYCSSFRDCHAIGEP